MERVHKGNLMIAWACILVLIIMTYLSFGTSAKTLQSCGVLLGTGILLLLIWRLPLSDLNKALAIVLLPSYATLIYSGLLGGNSVSFLATFITLGMAARYFDRRIIQYYAIPYVVVSSIGVRSITD